MERVTYYLSPPWALDKSLNQLYCMKRKPTGVRLAELEFEKGAKGSVPADWTEKRSDYYVCAEFTVVERIEQGRVYPSGPFRVVSVEENFITLEDRCRIRFSHPKWIQISQHGRSLYRSTARSLWSDTCACNSWTEESNLPIECLCATVYNRYCRVCSRRGSKCDRRTFASVTRYSETAMNATVGLQRPKNLKQEAHQMKRVKPVPDLEAKPTSKKTRKSRRGVSKQMEISLTIRYAGHDVPLEVFKKLKVFLEKEASMAVAALERGDSQLQFHIQAVVSVNTSSVNAFKTDVAAMLGWNVRCPPGASICAKSVKNNGLHTFTGLVGYCLKDEHEAHFVKYVKNVSEEQQEQGRKIHVIYGSSVYKNRVEITPNNILGRVLQFRKYRARHPLTLSFCSCLKQMMNCGQYMAGMKWLQGQPMSLVRAETVWKIAVNPSMVDIEDVEEVFFDTWKRDRYFDDGKKPNQRTAASDTDEGGGEHKGEPNKAEDQCSSCELFKIDRTGERMSQLKIDSTGERMRMDIETMLSFAKQNNSSTPPMPTDSEAARARNGRVEPVNKLMKPAYRSVEKIPPEYISLVG
ncbi:hypothetical protein R1sor_005525 [Riccia sorocarpa]|uniref:Replitron HUH endonuclease domain-containing protein n=1 Tax=Riccia sorocarpa TaxID=122646 RepID=A0ABD3HNI8_9MARC